jgi:hypothetical protein
MILQVAGIRGDVGVGVQRRLVDPIDSIEPQGGYVDGQENPDSNYDENITPVYTLEEVNKLLAEAQAKAAEEALEQAASVQDDDDKERVHIYDPHRYSGLSHVHRFHRLDWSLFGSTAHAAER